MRWQFQYVRSLILAALPFQSRLRAWKRRRSGIVGDPTNEPGAIFNGQQIVELVGRERIRGATVLEVGSGWQPLIPLLFKEAGAARVIMTDDKALMDEAYFEHAKEVLSSTSQLADVRFSDFEYHAPCVWSSITSESIDVLWSRAVLEHIPPPVLRNLLGEFRRILKPSGMMVHVIDNSDHWEHKDKSISRVNFLKFNKRVWRAINSHPLFYQNRLRHSDYLQMFRDAGFEIVRAEAEVCQSAVAALRKMRLSKEFQNRDPNDLAAITSYIVATPKPSHVAHAA